MVYFGVWHFVPPVETNNYLEAVNMKILDILRGDGMVPTPHNRTGR